MVESANQASIKTAGHEDEEEDDGLGFYPDGNKRTLTDEQISMFRHSEIYSILRERQVRKENEEAESSQDIASASTLKPNEGPDQVVLGTEQVMHANEPDHLEWPGNQSTSRKRNRQAGTSKNRQEKAHNSRRQVRELDSVNTKDQMLDYGEEPSRTPDTMDTESKTAETSEVDISTPKSPSGSEAVGGKKIWWPVIGK